MKKQIYLLLLALFAVAPIWADDTSPVVVDITEPGTLADRLSEMGLDAKTITSVKLTGTPDAVDIRTMSKQMTALQEVDLSGTTLTSIIASAFDSKTSLTKCILPNSATSIGSKAFYQCSKLVTVVLPKGLTSIGGSAFQGCSSLTSIDLPVGLTSIGDDAFCYCQNLTSVDLPVGLTSIGGRAFLGCYNLTSIDLPVGLTSIGWNSFTNCFNLTSVTLPASLTDIGGYAFSSCSQLKTINVEGSNVSAYEGAFDGVDKETCVVNVPVGTQSYYCFATAWTAFSNIEEMGIKSTVGKNGALECDGNAVADAGVLFHYAAPKTFKVMPAAGYVVNKVAFNNADITLNADNTFTVGEGIKKGMLDVSFKLKKFDLVANITGEGTISVDGNVLANGQTLGVDSSSVATILLKPAEGYVVKTLKYNDVECVAQQGGTLFVTPKAEGNAIMAVEFALSTEAGTTHKMQMTVGENGTVVYKNTPILSSSDIAVAEGEAAEFVITPDEYYAVASVTYNGVDVTERLTADGHLTLDGMTADGSLAVTFAYSPVVTVNIPLGKTLSAMLTDGQKEIITHLTVKGILSETDYTMMRDNMPLLSVLDLSESVCNYYMERTYNFIPCNAFNLSNYNSEGAKGKTSLTEVYLPKGLMRIEYGAFSGCTNLRKAHFEECTELVEILDYAFHKTALTDMDLSKTKVTEVYSNEWGNGFGKMSALATVEVPACLQRLNISGTNSIKEIDLSACEQLNYIYCQNSKSLEKVVLPKSSSLQEITINAFFDCDNLKSINLQDCSGLNAVGQSAFNSCNSLTNITLPAGLTSIGQAAFSYCSKLTGTIELPSTLVLIGENAFNGTNYTMCKTGATVPPTLTANTFSSTMVAAMVPESSIADYRAAAVWEDYVLISGENHAEVTVTTAGQLAVDILEQCKIAPAKVTHLKVHGPLNATDFAVIRSNMTVLYNLDLTDADVESIPQNALLDKLMLGSLKLPAKLVTIETGAFSGCTSLDDTITLPASLSTIGDRAFYNCSRLKGVEWSEALTKIGTEAFSGCNSLKQELTFPDKLETINNNAFYNCSSLYGTVTMPASLKSMPGRTENNWEYSGAAFYGCSNIAGVDMQKCVNLQGIGGNAFSGCSQLQTVLLPNTLTAIPKYAFDGCVKLDDVEFPDSLTTIGESAFQGCASLTVADFSNCKNMKSIDGYAFSGCSSLSTANLPESLTQINTYAFMDCKKLYNLSAANVVPATLGEYVFRRVNTDVCLLSIPTTSFYDYLIAAQWGAFVEMRAVIENHIDEGGRVTGENVNAEITEDVESDSVKSDGQRYAVIRDGSSVFVPKNGRIRYRVSPDENVSVKAVKYNDKDVTAELVDNVFTTPEVVEDGTLEVQFNVEGPINVTNVTLDRKKVNLLTAESTTLVAELSPRNATNKSLSWSSSDAKVARVDNAGKVTAVAPGVADITVTTADGAIYAQSRVTVLSNNYYFTMPETSAFVNTSLTVPVSMHNDEAVSGFQCDIYLPEGVEISSQYGDYNVSYAGRSSDHVLVTAKQNDGAIRVLGYSANNNSYNGNDGVLFNLPIETSGVIGGKEIKIKNIHVAGPEAIDFAAPDISMTLNVNDYSLGDSNGDGNVTVSDVTNTANYVLNKYVSKFVFDAADVNADKAITIADVTGTASITLGQWGGNASSKAKGYNINTVETADRLYVEDFTIADGEEKTISFMLNNSVAYVGVQFDLYLPEGLTAVKDKYGDYTFELAEDRKGEKNYLLGSQLQPTGAVRVLANPSNNTPFVGNEGAIMTLTLKADGLKAGTHQIKIGNIKFSDALAAHDYDLPEAETTVTVNPTDVTNIGETVGHKDDIIYNINGVRVERPTTSGLYIVNGKTYRHK